jgi:hypothetical protein
VAYVFKKDRPNGWVEMTTMAGKASLRLYALDKQHPEQGAKVDVALG